MYKNIMVPLDGSELAECVLPHVDGFVSAYQVGTLVFVRVLEPTPNRFGEMSSGTSPHEYENIQKKLEKMEEERKSSAQRYLEEVVSRVKRDGVKFKTEVLIGKVAEKLVDFVDANDIDLVLIATHGRSGISRWVRGSIADKVLRSSSAPVLMVRADGKTGGGKI